MKNFINKFTCNFGEIDKRYVNQMRIIFAEKHHTTSRSFEASIFTFFRCLLNLGYDTSRYRVDVFDKQVRYIQSYLFVDGRVITNPNILKQNENNSI